MAVRILQTPCSFYPRASIVTLKYHDLARGSLRA